MAFTAKISVALRLLDTNLTELFNLGWSQLEKTLAGADWIYRSQVIGSAAEALDIGEIGIAGYMICRNAGPTDTISLRIGSGGADLIKLAVNDIAVFPLAAATPYAIASSTNSPVLQYAILEA